MPLLSSNRTCNLRPGLRQFALILCLAHCFVTVCSINGDRVNLLQVGARRDSGSRLSADVANVTGSGDSNDKAMLAVGIVLFLLLLPLRLYMWMICQSGGSDPGFSEQPTPRKETILFDNTPDGVKLGFRLDAQGKCVVPGSVEANSRAGKVLGTNTRWTLTGIDGMAYSYKELQARLRSGSSFQITFQSDAAFVYGQQVVAQRMREQHLNGRVGIISDFKSDRGIVKEDQQSCSHWCPLLFVALHSLFECFANCCGGTAESTKMEQQSEQMGKYLVDFGHHGSKEVEPDHLVPANPRGSKLWLSYSGGRSKKLKLDLKSRERLEFVEFLSFLCAAQQDVVKKERRDIQFFSIFGNRESPGMPIDSRGALEKIASSFKRAMAAEEATEWEALKEAIRKAANSNKRELHGHEREQLQSAAQEAL